MNYKKVQELVANGNINHIKLLLVHGSDINIKNEKAKTALNHARHKKMKTLLKSYGAYKYGYREARTSFKI